MWSVFFLLLASAVTSSLGQDSGNNPATSFPFGSPWFCLDRARAKGYQMEALEVLPGFGWDNLCNVNEGQVVSFNYSQCRTTDDGRFLLPDSVSAVPVKTSRVQYFAELIDHWKEWTSTNSRSINVDAGVSWSFVNISGKFSYDFSEVKSKQIQDKSDTTRAQLRYTRYSVQLQPGSPLHPVFRKRVLGIAAAYALNQEEKANFLSEILVRDFGTHMVTKADAGAALIQLDQVKEAWIKKVIDKKSKILASATINFFRSANISVGPSYESKDNDTFLQNYTNNRTSSTIYTEGGRPFLPSDFSRRNWAESIDKDLVALDRSGNPLHYVITEEALPELPISVLRKVRDGIKEAVAAYYSYNAIPGCLDSDSPNFTPSANMDDGSCQKPTTNLTFGGVYQNCSMTVSENGDLCKGLREVNPLSGGYSCPSGYRSVKLHSGNTSSSRSENECTRSFPWFSQTCSTKHYRSRAEYEMYWCVATGRSLPAQSGYLFGGLFTSKVNNPVTHTTSCPPAFFPLNIGDQADLHICITDEHEFGRKRAIPLGGFYSCEMGNPIAVENRPGAGDLGDFYENKSSEWPKKCPPGYSAHLASVDQGCQINYCVTTGSLAGPVLPPLKRPPFSPDPPLSPPQTDGDFRFDPVSDTWKRHEESTTTPTPQDPPTFAPLRSAPSSGDTAVPITLWVTVASLPLSFLSASQWF